MGEREIALVTGATSGFGRAIARRFAAEGLGVIITGRREDRLEALRQELEKDFNAMVSILCFDVRNHQDVETQLNGLPAELRKIDVLVNNAGLALGREGFAEGDLDKWEQMIDTNIKGLIYVTRVVSPWMTARKQGTIINIGSIAGKETYPGGNVYSATKFAVDALTKSMRLDFLSSNIRVSQIAPGAAETEFSIVRFSGDEQKAKAVYHGFIPLSAEDIADAAWFIVSRPAHVCINDLVIMPTAQANATTINRSQS
jgi:3-hydroxy acid dehydrogenase / malonic semialdehyde reductase